MRQAIFFAGIFLVFLFVLPFAAGFSNTEDTAIIRATVIGFETGEDAEPFITLQITDILEYHHKPDSEAPALEPDTNLSFGYLWGHQDVVGPYPDLRPGYEIIANVSLHYMFSSHVGHLYSYEIVCGDDEILTDEGCIPLECEPDERLVGSKCIPLDCGFAQGYRNHSCYDLDCETDEKIQDHRCVGLVCAEDEFASNHICQKLDCGLDEIAQDHQCIPLFCGVFTRVDNSACVIDWTQLAVFIAVTFITLYLIYALLIKDLFGGKKKGGNAFANKKGIILVFLVALVILVLPAAARLIFHSPLLPGAESYQNQIISGMLMEGKARFTLGSGINAYHLIVAYLGGIFGLDNVARLLPIIFGTFSATLFYLITRKIIDDAKVSTLTTIMLVFSPAFIYLFSVSTPDSLISFALLAGIYLSLSSRRLSVLFGGLVLALVSLYDPVVFALSIAGFLIIMLNTKNNHNLRIALMGLIALVGLYFSIFQYGYAQPLASFRKNVVEQSITDFGGTIGFGIFHVILFFSGLIYSWEKKRDFAPIYILLVFILGLVLWLDKNYNAYLNFIVICFIGIALSRFANAKWEAQQLKNIALLVLFCGLLFSTVSYAKRISFMEPEPELADALTRLSEYPPGIVLSHSSYSEFIEYFANMPAFVKEGDSMAVRRLNISEEIFYSRRLDHTKALIEEGDIRYILIDRKMRQGLVWDSEGQGLLFVLGNKDSFRRLFGKEVDIEIWEYIPSNITQT